MLLGSRCGLARRRRCRSLCRRGGRGGRSSSLGGRCRRRLDRSFGWRCGGGRRCSDNGIRDELALAVQLVEQRFELVLGDMIAACRRRNGLGRCTRGARQCIDGKVTLAVQLIEQCFELIVGDVTTGVTACGGCNGRFSCGTEAVGGELALAVQLVEQRLELGVGDFVTGRLGHLGLGFGLDRIERIEQLFEFGIGDIRFGLGRWRFNHLRFRCSNLVFPGRLGQARQRRQQLRGGRGDIGALAHLAEHAVDRVQGFQDHVHQFGINAPGTLAQDVEHVFGDMAALHQLVELEEAGAPFYSVKTAKNCIEQIGIIRTAFQLDQLLGQLLKNFAGFYQEILKDFFIGAEAH
ncbi:hypothetical protein D3C78_1017360 [compost metagenome]